MGAASLLTDPHCALTGLLGEWAGRAWAVWAPAGGGGRPGWAATSVVPGAEPELMWPLV